MLLAPFFVGFFVVHLTTIANGASLQQLPEKILTGAVEAPKPTQLEANGGENWSKDGTTVTKDAVVHRHARKCGCPTQYKLKLHKGGCKKSNKGNICLECREGDCTRPECAACGCYRCAKCAKGSCNCSECVDCPCYDPCKKCSEGNCEGPECEGCSCYDPCKYCDFDNCDPFYCKGCLCDLCRDCAGNCGLDCGVCPDCFVDNCNFCQTCYANGCKDGVCTQRCGECFCQDCVKNGCKKPDCVERCIECICPRCLENNCVGDYCDICPGCRDCV